MLRQKLSKWNRQSDLYLTTLEQTKFGVTMQIRWFGDSARVAIIKHTYMIKVNLPTT